MEAKRCVLNAIPGYAECMATKTISVRLDLTDVGRLKLEARRLGVSAGTYARVLIRAGLDSPQEPTSYTRAIKLRALDKRLRAGWPKDAMAVDAVALVRQGRDEQERRVDGLGLPTPSP
jgi:hypothetical protein